MNVLAASTIKSMYSMHKTLGMQIAKELAS